jgi:hypothetical protein
LHSQLVFQGTDLLAQRRLLDAERLRGPSEVQVLGNGQKIAKMPQLQGLSPSRFGWQDRETIASRYQYSGFCYPVSPPGRQRRASIARGTPAPQY